jgi:ATP-dependent helicase HrpB
MVGGSGVRLARESAVRQGELFLAIDARHDQRSVAREALVRIASIVRPQWLEEIFPQSIRRESGAEFDSQRQRVVGFNRVWYLDLLLREDRDSPIDGQLAGEILSKEFAPRAAELFTADEKAKQLLLRVGLLRQHLPEHPWPQFDTEMLGDLLTQRCAGKRSVAEALSESLEQVLLGALVYPLDRILQQQAPEMIEVPSGSQIALQYSENQPPVLAVRLQELFGLTATPTVAGGRVRVRLHLLGPNYRPVQITDDLQNFWATTYFQVRKDLRARYPKHSWPENPLTAKAEAKGKRRN